MTVAVVGTVRGVHVVAAGNEMRKQSMTCHPGIDDGDSLSGSARELPDLLQIEALQLSAIGCAYACGRCCDATLCCLVGRGGAGGRGLGNIESSTAGGMTANAAGAAQNGKVASTPAAQSLAIRAMRAVMAGSDRGPARKGR